MWRRLILWCSVTLVLTLVIAFAVPFTRYRILGLLHGESLYEGRPLGYWLEALTEDDSKERRRAALILGDAAERAEEAPRQRVIASLLAALGDSDSFVRKCAATSYLIYPRDTPVSTDRATVACLLDALKDDEVVVRRAAIQALWQAGPAAKENGGVTRVTDALADKDEFVRAYAARALARIGPDAASAVPTLLAHLRTDEDRDIRKLAAKALGLIGPKAVGAALPDTVDALMESLKQEPPGLRNYAARALGQLGARQAIPALKTLAQKDRSPQVRAGAAEALKSLTADAGP